MAKMSKNKAKLIGIKPEFKEVLVKLGVYKRYMGNLTKYNNNDYLSVNIAIKSLNKCTTFSSFLDSSFLWELTLEKHHFWINIEDKGIEIMNKLKSK